MFMCRLCLKETDSLRNIIDSQLKCAEWTLVESIFWIFGVKVDVNDPHTKFICERCESAIRCIGKYRELYKKNQLVLELSLKSKNQELTNQSATPLKCTTATQTTPLPISSPKAKKRRLALIDYYYKTPTKAIRELVHRKAGNAYRKEKTGKNEGTEEPLVQVQEIEVKVCKYCSKTFNTKQHLEIHCNSQHGSLRVKNKLRKVGRPKKHAKGKSKKEQLETVLSRIKDPGRVGKNKYRQAFSFPNLNFMKELDLRENNSDIGKNNTSETTGLAEDADSTLPTDSSTPKCSKIEIKTISVKGLLENKEDIVKMLNKRHAWLNLKDFSIPINRDIITTKEIDCTEMEEESNPVDKSTDVRSWKNNLSGTLQTLSLITKSEAMKEWMKISTVTEENEETDSENDDVTGFEGTTGIGDTNSSEDGDSEESPEVQNPSKPLPEESNPLDKSSHANVSPDIPNWKNNLSVTLQTLSLINQSNNMKQWMTVSEENQETDSENDDAGGFKGTGIGETNSSEDGDNKESPEVQDASKPLPESTTKVEEESNPLDKSSHTNVGPKIPNWKNNLSGTLQTLSLINESDSMNQWMKISTVTEDTDLENDDADGFEGITGIGETDNSENSDTEESPEVQDASEPLTDIQLALEEEDPAKTITSSQQKKKTDEVVQEDQSKTTQKSKNVEEVEIGDSDSTTMVVKKSQVQETEGKQKDVSKRNDKMTEMQNMKEHILSTLRKIKEIKERTAMNQRGGILQTEKEETNNDSKIAEPENTIENAPTVPVQDKGEIPQNSDESEEEAAENTWEEDRDSLNETEVADLGTSNLDEIAIAAEKIIHVAADDIIFAQESEPVAIKQEQQGQTSAPEHPLTANANERVEWKKNMSSSLTKLQQINTIEVLEKSIGSHELGSEDDTLSNGTEFILPDDNFDEDSEHDVGRLKNMEIDEAEAENTTEDASIQENSQLSTDESEDEAAGHTWEEGRDSLSETEVADLSMSNLDETAITAADDIIYVPESEPAAIKQKQQDQTSPPEYPLTVNENERVEWKKNISSSLTKLQQINTIEVLEKWSGSQELESKDDTLSNASEFILPDDSALEHPITANANERIEWKKNISVSLTKLRQTFEILEKSTGSQELGSKDDTLSNSNEFILPDDNFDEDSERDVGGEENIEIDEDSSEEDVDKLDTMSINEELPLLNGKELVVSIERCPIQLHQNCRTSEKSSQTAANKKWKNKVPETLLKLKKAAIMNEDLLENEDMVENSDSENEMLINYLNRNKKGIKTITVNQSCLLEDDQTVLNTLNDQHSWLNLKEFCISVTSCKVPSEVRQSIIAERNKWKESISTLLPKMKELKENDAIKEKIELVKTRVHVERSNEPELVVDTNENEGEIATTILTDCEGDNRDPLRGGDAKNNDHEVILTVSLSNSSEIANNIKQLQLKDFHIPLERIHEPTNVNAFGLRYWKRNVSKTVQKLQSIKEEASEEDKSKIADVKPIATGSKRIIKLDYNFVRKLSKKLKDNSPTTDDMYELAVDPNSFEFEAQVISINHNPENNDHSQNTQEKTDSAVIVQQDIILNRSLTQDEPEDAEEIPTLAENLIENNLPVTNCIIETIDIGPQGSPEIEVSRENQELSANQEECENQSQQLGDILEQASIWIQQNTEDTDGIEQGRKNSLVQIEDLVQNQENEAVPNQKSQVPTEKVVHETYEDLVASLQIEGTSTPPTTGNNIQDEEINTDDVAPCEEIDAFDSENEINNEADRQTYEALVKNLETETESQTHTEQAYPVQKPTEDISQKQKTTVQTEDERQEAKKPEKEFKNKKLPAREDTKSEPQTHSPIMKHPTTSEPTDPKNTGHKSNFKKKTKKEKSKVPCCPHHRPDLILKAGERVPSTTHIMDHNPVQIPDSEENKAHGSKSDGKPSKQRKKTKNITLMNETDRLTRDVEQLTRYLNLLKLMEDNQKSLNSSGGKLPSSTSRDDPVKKTSDKRQETANKEEQLAKGRTTDSTEENSGSLKTNHKNTLTLKDQDRKENNTNTVVSDKRAEEIKMWRAHLNSTLSKIKQIQSSKLFTSKMDAATKILPDKENEKDDVRKT